MQWDRTGLNLNLFKAGSVGIVGDGSLHIKGTFEKQLLFLCVCGAGVLTEGFMFTKQALYCLSHTSSPFCYGYFGEGVL
jgi:hypothetical protein